MDDLRSLIKVLRVGEKRMLKYLLSRTTNAEEHQRYRLFKLIDLNNGISEDAVKTHLGDISSSSFSHLKKRLREDILSVLLIKESTKRIAQANRAAQFECIKKLGQAYVLLFRGAKDESSKILESVRELASDYELLGERIQMHHLIRENFIGVGASSELESLNDEIGKDVRAYQALLEVEEKSILISSPEYVRQMTRTKNFEEWAVKVDELEQYYKKFDLDRIGFWYYLVSTEFNTARGDFEKVIFKGKQFLKLVESSPAVKSKNNVAGVNQSLGFAYLNLRSYGSAIVHFKQSEKNFPVSGFNRLQALFFIACSQVASAEYEAALNTFQTAMAHPRIKAREPLVPRWLFLKASTEFLMGNTDAAFKTINQDGYLLRQQDEWNIQFRLLEMMLLVELRDEEWLEFKLDATRKFLTRYKQLDTPRVRAAVDILSNLLRRDLNAEELSEKNLLALNNSFNEIEGFEWNPSGTELVRFDKWLKAKLPETDNEGQELDEE
jgi:tetratricopeptide (TPR) repeat protein